MVASVSGGIFEVSRELCNLFVSQVERDCGAARNATRPATKVDYAALLCTYVFNGFASTRTYTRRITCLLCAHTHTLAIATTITHKHTISMHAVDPAAAFSSAVWVANSLRCHKRTTPRQCTARREHCAAFEYHHNCLAIAELLHFVSVWL